MGYERFVGSRYLMAKRRSSVLSIITIISITGVALGVTALIVVLSVMGGFKKDLKEKILGTKAHIVVRGVDFGTIKDYDEVAQKVEQDPAVTGASPYLEAEVMVSSPTNLSGVIMRGINTQRITQVSSLANDIERARTELKLEAGELKYLDDSRPLMKALNANRDKDMQRLMERLDRERKELDKEKNTPPPKDAGELLPKGFKPVLKTEGEMPALPGQEEGGMPPLPGQEATNEGSMPDLPGQEGTMPDLPGQDANDGEMPALPGDDDPTEKNGDGIPGLIIGPELAKSLHVSLGNEVNVVTPNGDMGPMGPIPKSRPFRVVGIFYSGMYEYDANFAYTTIDDAKAFLSSDGVTGLELKTTDVEQATMTAGRLRTLLGPSIEVLDWKQLNSSLFYALKLEKIAMFIVLTFIILVASFSIVAMLIMIVIEKAREIAILKSMGATDGGIMRTFIFQGTVIGGVGALIGLVLGLAICLFLAKVGFPLNSEVYYISTLPVDVNPVEVVTVVFSAVLISLLATVYPSIQAARLKPVDGLRYD